MVCDYDVMNLYYPCILNYLTIAITITRRTGPHVFFLPELFLYLPEGLAKAIELSLTWRYKRRRETVLLGDRPRPQTVRLSNSLARAVWNNSAGKNLVK